MMTSTVRTPRLIHDPGRAIEIAPSPGALPVLRYVYSGAPKPYFHPLLGSAGIPLTIYEPYDHLWHRGLWFTIKLVNGENFWEESAPFGTQETEPYPEVIARADGAVAVSSALEWRRSGGEIALEEQREWVWRATEDGFSIDWQSRLTPTRDTLLDRTPYTTWGGYGGLVFRGTRELHETRFLIPDGESERMRGERAPWCDLSGRLDGGPNLSAGVCFLDHPQNPRHPTPFYGHPAPGTFLNAAFLFHEPLRLPAGETLTLRYRVLIHSGAWSTDRAQAEHARYVDELAPGV
jgi:hypothetical protein